MNVLPTQEGIANIINPTTRRGCAGKKQTGMKYYIVKETKYGKEYKKYKCIDGFCKDKELCWKFSKQGALGIIGRLEKQYAVNYGKGLLKLYIEPAE